ncbi:hypothetical protein B5V01_07695 [Mesorhizobium erdmanii]|uniref:Uncharacterized protein n=3 Tax=Phyllobacteriaceae TaxID=69277 RepID=A0A3M9X315_9HYPH|nr:hypothetical protein DNR46_29000 [Mesorhizobium japonicum]RXT47950.1 hypothetical protein B5V01_07695 [Mesorhizobium erdmanii]
MLDDVDTLVFDTDEASYLAECIRLRGQIAAGRGDVTGASHLLETAIATGGRQQARLFELRAATQLAPVLARQGRAHEAATRLQAVVHTFSTRYSIVDLIAAQRALVRWANETFAALRWGSDDVVSVDWMKTVARPPDLVGFCDIRHVDDA